MSDDISHFKESAPLSLGVELELQLVSRQDFRLTRAASDLIDAVENDGRYGDIKLEITESMIEVSTGARNSADAILTDLKALCGNLAAACRRHNIAASGGGTHPFHRWPACRISPGARFDQLYQRYGYLAKQFTVFGQHIHIGCRSGDEAIWLTQALGNYVPAFIALSASSPFVDGVDTGFQSARLNVVSAFPLSGQCPPLADWAAFVEHFRFLQACGVAASIKDLYWDIRPKPEFGTVEIRVCDTPLSIHRAAAMAALAQMLCRYLLRTRPPLATEHQCHVARHNRFQACRYGMAAALADPGLPGQIALHDMLNVLLDALAVDAQELGSGKWLLALRHLVHQGSSDADWLRSRFSVCGNLNDVVHDAADRLLESTEGRDAKNGG